MIGEAEDGTLRAEHTLSDRQHVVGELFNELATVWLVGRGINQSDFFLATSLQR